jgi:cytidylate kinase
MKAVEHDPPGEHTTEHHDERPRVFVVTGIMVAGKSTVAQALAERFTRSVHVRGDVFRRMIVSSSAPITPSGGEAMDAELRLRYRLSAMVTEEYARAGYTVVVQDVILGADLATYVGMITHRPLSVVVLAPRPEVVARREATRPKKGYIDWTVEALDASLRKETPRLGLWLDTSDQTPEQTVTRSWLAFPRAILLNVASQTASQPAAAWGVTSRESTGRLHGLVGRDRDRRRTRERERAGAPLRPPVARARQPLCLEPGRGARTNRRVGLTGVSRR